MILHDEIVNNGDMGIQNSNFNGHHAAPSPHNLHHIQQNPNFNIIQNGNIQNPHANMVSPRLPDLSRPHSSGPPMQNHMQGQPNGPPPAMSPHLQQQQQQQQQMNRNQMMNILNQNNGNPNSIPTPPPHSMQGMISPHGNPPYAGRPGGMQSPHLGQNYPQPGISPHPPPNHQLPPHIVHQMQQQQMMGNIPHGARVMSPMQQQQQQQQQQHPNGGIMSPHGQPPHPQQMMMNPNQIKYEMQQGGPNGMPPHPGMRGMPPHNMMGPHMMQHHPQGMPGPMQQHPPGHIDRNGMISPHNGPPGMQQPHQMNHPHAHPHAHPHHPHNHPHGPPNGHPGMMPPPHHMHMHHQNGSKLYPPNMPMIFNPQNPNAPPIYPCGVCHREVQGENDEAMMCESGCNFWFHRTCVGMMPEAYLFLKKEVYAEWVCDNCVQSKRIAPIKFKS